MSSTKRAPSRQAAKRPVRPSAARSVVPLSKKRISGISELGRQLAEALEKNAVDGNANAIDGEVVQKLIAALCKTYSAQVDGGRDYLPLRMRTSASSTDVLMTASGLMRAANLAVFELGVWQSWTGR
jgi:hypothetical protein